MPKPSSTCRRTAAPSAQWESVQPNSDTDLLCITPMGCTNSAPEKAPLLPSWLSLQLLPSVACGRWWHRHVNSTWQWGILSVGVCAKKTLICSRNYKPCSYLHWNPCRNSPPPLPSLLACSNSRQTEVKGKTMRKETWEGQVRSRRKKQKVWLCRAYSWWKAFAQIT